MQVKLIKENAILPTRATRESAGYDLYCLEGFDLLPQSRVLVPTGLVIGIPEGYYGRIAPRSGLSLKYIDIGGGVIDSDYRGEIKVILINNSSTDIVRFQQKDRIAQLIIEKIITPELVIVDVIDEELRNKCYSKDKECTLSELSERGEGGFGSSG